MRRPRRRAVQPKRRSSPASATAGRRRRAPARRRPGSPAGLSIDPVAGAESPVAISTLEPRSRRDGDAAQMHAAAGRRRTADRQALLAEHQGAGREAQWCAEPMAQARSSPGRSRRASAPGRDCRSAARPAARRTARRPRSEVLASVGREGAAGIFRHGQVGGHARRQLGRIGSAARGHRPAAGARRRR